LNKASYLLIKFILQNRKLTLKYKPEFTAHNILLDDKTFTMDAHRPTMNIDSRFLSASRVFKSVLHAEKSQIRIADLGCLEGGYATEFARLGYDTLGIEVRDSNFAACEYVKEKTNLPNLHFAQDTALNLANYGRFDGVFLCGLLYHLENPRAYLQMLGKLTRKVLILQTHFSVGDEYASLGFQESPFNLSGVTSHEGLQGRWFQEFTEGTNEKIKDSMRWASWENHRSFWPNKDQLLLALHEAGFNLIFEQFDDLMPELSSYLSKQYYTLLRGTFVGIKA
jgi:SAM-dependent methyltransferase